MERGVARPLRPFPPQKFIFLYSTAQAGDLLTRSFLTRPGSSLYLPASVPGQPSPRTYPAYPWSSAWSSCRS
eukprot:6063580-Pyramimonas_sp.AAC.1